MRCVKTLLNEILTQLHYIPLAAFLTVFFAIAFIFFKENNEEAKNKLVKMVREDGWTVAFLFYSALLLAGTLMGRPHTNPFVNVIGHIGFGKEDSFLTDGLVNILMFVPYTYLYIKAFRPDRFVRKCFYLSTATTVIIELCQLLFWVGQFSLGDILYNVIGGMVGCGLWWFINTFIGHKANDKIKDK